MELRKSCAAAIAGSGGKGEEIVISIRVAKGRGIFEKLGRLAEPRVLAVTSTCLLPLIPPPLSLSLHPGTYWFVHQYMQSLALRFSQTLCQTHSVRDLFLWREVSFFERKAVTTEPRSSKPYKSPVRYFQLFFFSPLCSRLLVRNQLG